MAPFLIAMWLAGGMCTGLWLYLGPEVHRMPFRSWGDVVSALVDLCLLMVLWPFIAKAEFDAAFERRNGEGE